MKLNEIIGKTETLTAAKLTKSIENGKFTIDGSKLKVAGNFYCNYSELTSLEGAPSSVDGNFYCNVNQLTNLEGAPSSVGEDFDCCDNELTSLEGAPSSVGGNFYCNYNELTSLAGVPSSVGRNFSCRNNKLTSLSNIHKTIKEVDGYMNFEKNPIKSSVLGLVKIKGLTRIMFDNKKLQKIMNKYLPLGDILDCQEELIEAGLDEYAQL